MTRETDPAAKAAASDACGVVLPNSLRRQADATRAKNSIDQTIGKGNHPA
jgi:hypothetical protein